MGTGSPTSDTAFFTIGNTGGSTLFWSSNVVEDSRTASLEILALIDNGNYMDNMSQIFSDSLTNYNLISVGSTGSAKTKNSKKCLKKQFLFRFWMHSHIKQLVQILGLGEFLVVNKKNI